jgi:hypothetical protein
VPARLRVNPKIKQALRLLAAGLVLLGLIPIAWTFWPHNLQRQTLQFSAENLAKVGFSPQQQAVLEEYHLAQISLEWPDYLRIGENGRITLTIEPQTEAAPVSTSQSLAIDARLDLAGLTFYPANEVRTALRPRNLLRLFWQVQASRGGVYSGSAWLYIVFPPASSTKDSPEVVLPLSAQNLAIRAVSLAGLDVLQARLLSAAIIAVGMLLMLIVVIKS